MPLGDFVEPGTMGRPLLIGRAARILFGVGTLFYFVWLLTQFTKLVGSVAPHPGWWAGVAVAFWFLPDIVVVGFSRPWGRWPQLATLLLAAVLIVTDLVAYGSVWGPPLGWGMFSLTAFFFGFFAMSFLVAGTLAVPG